MSSNLNALGWKLPPAGMLATELKRWQSKIWTGTILQKKKSECSEEEYNNTFPFVCCCFFVVLFFFCFFIFVVVFFCFFFWGGGFCIIYCILENVFSKHSNIVSSHGRIKIFGAAGYRSPYLSHAKRALYHLSYSP